MIAPLAIIQARMGSTRLKNKMLLEVGSRTLIRRAWDASVEAFGESNVVVATPSTQENVKLIKHAHDMGAEVFVWDGPEEDVLGRFFHCAHRYRWNPSSVIVRVTPDDWAKDPAMMRRVAAGERLPVELGGEAFTLAMLDKAHYRVKAAQPREHLSWVFYPTDPPPPPPGVWSVDTQEDLDAARKRSVVFPHSDFVDPLEGL